MKRLAILAASWLFIAAGIPYATFEDGVKSLDFTADADDIAVTVVDNPLKNAANPSARCLQVVTTDMGRNVISALYGRTFDFTLDPPVFTMKVLAPAKGLKVTVRLVSVNPIMSAEPVTLSLCTSKAGEWETMNFDFASTGAQSNKYRKFVISFQKPVTGNAPDWYIDDFYGPSDDLSSLCLFRRWEGNPLLKSVGKMEDGWRSVSIANAAILSPEESPTGKWVMYVRGSGTPRQSIGMFWQEPEEFSPVGPWKECQENPVVAPSPRGTSWDDSRILDTAPVVDKDGKVYIYYKGYGKNGKHYMGVAWSEDGGLTFRKTGRPWREDVGGSTSVVFHRDSFFVFCGSRVIVSADPLDGSDAKVSKGLLRGGAPSNFDDRSLWGNNVWRLEGVDKWFMTYQGSATHGDFPDRFHVAYSDDLIHWKKVDNAQPLFTRGAPGGFDSGAIWCPEVFEHEGMLYLYYEGWGRDGMTFDRDECYWKGGRSSVNIAVCPKDKFLEWCGLK